MQQRNQALTSIKTQLGVLKGRVDVLKVPGFFDSRIATSSSSTMATALASNSAALGAFTFSVSQLATAAAHRGAADAGARLNATNDVSSLVLGAAGLAVAVTDGAFTVNGQQVAISTTDTLQAVFDKIQAATNNAVTARYESSTDQIILSSTGEIVLGSATDTSNFLQAVHLRNNGTGAVASDNPLGAIKLSGPLNQANLATPVSDGGNGAGEFKINGVSLSFNASQDSVANVIDRINNSGAGVNAGYDAVNDRFTLTNKNTGDIGLALEDVTGNFLAASGLSGGTLERGKDLLYTLNGGGQLSSRSNTLGETSSGLPGLSVSVLAAGSFTVTVGADTAKIKTAITDFVAEYNKTQALINTHTASSTDAQGKVTAGLLAADPDAGAIVSRLRSLITADLSGLTSAVPRLDSLGFSTNGNDDSLDISDTTQLDTALASQLNGLKELFTHSSAGLAINLGAYLESTIDEGGSLVTHQDSLSAQASGIDTQVADMERLVLSNRQLLIEKFIAMETAQAKINQQLQFLQQRFQ